MYDYLHLVISSYYNICCLLLTGTNPVDNFMYVNLKLIIFKEIFLKNYIKYYNFLITLNSVIITSFSL